MICTKCKIKKDQTDFYGKAKHCKDCHRLLNKEWLSRPGNREKMRSYQRIAAKKAREIDPERLSLNKKRSEIKLKKETMDKYGGQFCACCNETNIFFLTIDHINNDGAVHRKDILKDYSHTKRGDISGRQFYAWLKKNNYPALPLQVLCYNCNCGKAANKGQCPHKGIRWNI